MDELVRTVAIALGRFPKLETFTLDQPSDHDCPINKVLELAILSHPTLRTISYDLWHSPHSSYTFSFKPTRSQPLTLERIAYAYEFESYPRPLLSPRRFYQTIFDYVSYVQSLELSALQSDGYPLPLLLTNPIAGLVNLSIASGRNDPFPLHLSQTEWLSLFLKAHPLVQTISFEDGNPDPAAGDDEGAFRLLWKAFSWVQGLEGLSDETSVSWGSFGAVRYLAIDSPEGEERPVVSFEIEGVDSDDARPSLDAVFTEGLASAFPNLENLAISGSFGTPHVSSIYDSVSKSKPRLVASLSSRCSSLKTSPPSLDSNTSPDSIYR